MLIDCSCPRSSEEAIDALLSSYTSVKAAIRLDGFRNHIDVLTYYLDTLQNLYMTLALLWKMPCPAQHYKLALQNSGSTDCLTYFDFVLRMEV